MNQNDMVLNHMKVFGSITQQDAGEMYGIMRLGARIGELRKAGYAIKTVTEKGKNRFGKRTHYARYRMEGKDG